MRLVKFVDETGSICVGVLKDPEYIIDISSFLKLNEINRAYDPLENLVSLDISSLNDLERWAFLPENEIFRVSVNSVKVLAAVTETAMIIGVSKNYYDYLEKAKMEVPDSPSLFIKIRSSVSNPEDEVQLPRLSEKITYEAELAVVIGKEGKNISVEDAMEYVFGYTVFNDFTAVDVIAMDKNLFRAKNFDGFSSVGPHLVTKDEIMNPHELKIQLWLNDELLQDSSTNQMIKDIPQLINFISQDITLYPGDIIATGSPCGVANQHNPVKFLQHGDQIRITVENIGSLNNSMV